MVALDPNTIEDFSNITSYDLNSYLKAFNIFQQQYYSNITKFYSGKSSIVPIKELKILKNLKSESENISSLFNSYKQSLNKLNFWFLVEFLDDLKIEILSMLNIGRFYRASVSSSGYGAATEFPYTINDQQTLENIEEKILNSNDPNQDWVQLALRNDLRENEYEINDAGNNIVIFKPINVVNYNLQSVVDYLNGLNFYGKDINKKISFVVDEDDDQAKDLDVVKFQDAYIQAVKIMIEVRKGSIPEYPALGISGWVGSNLNVFNFKSFIRQITEVFKSDDTILGFTIPSLSYKEGSVYINFEVNSFYNLVYVTNTKAV